MGYAIVLVGMVVAAAWAGMGPKNREQFFKHGIK